MKYDIALGYTSKLDLVETIEGVEKIKEEIFNNLRKQFKLQSVSSSLATEKSFWLNDDYQLTERPIDFDTNISVYGEILQSNNKWRRYFLYKMGLNKSGEGIISNFKTIRRDSRIDNMTSVVYEEVGLEIISEKADAKEIQNYCIQVYDLITKLDKNISKKYNSLNDFHFGDSLTFISYKELKSLYPFLSHVERINKFTKENGSIVLTNFVEKLLGQKNKVPYSEDVFNFDYYTKIYVYNLTTEKAMSIGYVSYQVDREALKEQNVMLKENWKNNNSYNHMIKSNELPLTISIGIHTNRVAMAILEKYHIGEVHCSIWSEEFLDYCIKNKINIL